GWCALSLPGGGEDGELGPSGDAPARGTLPLASALGTLAAVDGPGRVNIRLRPGTPEDAEACGRICYEAFSAVAAAHGAPCDFPSADVATALVSGLLTRPGIFSVVAEAGGEV